MKKVLICSNALLLGICLLLCFLLLNANDQLQQAQAQSINAPISDAPASVPSTELTPTPEILATPEDTEDLNLYHVAPLGSLPLSVSRNDDAANIFVQALEEHNPIDDFFEYFWPLDLSTMEDNAVWWDYEDAWKAEVLHAYDQLAQLANPNADFLIKELDEAKEALLDFAKKDGILYASVFCSDGYDKMFHYEELPMYGTAWPGVSAMTKASHYREYAIYLHLVLKYWDVEADFVFDPEPLKESWDYLME